MIIGTAGHIDHGKTTLVRALTGVDTDRLPEEKRRGISIELGYAYLRTTDGPLSVSLGFVDVPGHERFLHTMLAGATGIDHALLVVAADDGVMPQTREHLAVLALLGIDQGCIVITKCDRFDASERAARIAEVRAQIDVLVAPTPLAHAPVFPVSAQTGDGLEAVRHHLVAAARAARVHDEAQAFRIAVDRAFTLTGVGTVVTGTVFGGRARIGDELRVMPGDRLVRVRGIHAQNERSDTATAGQRCALALAGVAKEEVRRGDWICAPGIALTTERIDVQITLWPDEAHALRSGTPVHVHLGASDVMASVALLDRDVLAPGDTALAQLVLREPVSAWRHDRGVLRDASATRTLGGVRVLDPYAPARYRRTSERLQTLAACSLDDRMQSIAALLVSAPLGLDIDKLTRACALVDRDAVTVPADAVRITDAWVISRAHLDALKQSTVDRLAEFHRAAPEEMGPDMRRLKRLAAPRADDALWRQTVDALTDDGALARTGTWLHLPDHAARLSATEERLAQKLLPRLAEGGFDPPWVRDLAKDVAAPEPVVRQTLASLARRGQAFQVVKDLYYPAATIAQLARIARECGLESTGLQAGSFRDATGLGRKRAIQLIEFFDRIGFTRRVKDTHLLRPDTQLFS